MICDDEPDLLKLFGTALKSKYNVILVSSGKDCIEKFIEEINQGNKIDLLLLDEDIPGDSVVRKIKEYNGTKIILISAYSSDDSLPNELKENNYIAKYIEKPIRLSSLIKLVEETIS
jgi:DNA-binding NtrC family response regulator